MDLSGTTIIEREMNAFTPGRRLSSSLHPMPHQAMRQPWFRQAVAVAAFLGLGLSVLGLWLFVLLPATLITLAWWLSLVVWNATTTNLALEVVVEVDGIGVLCNGRWYRIPFEQIQTVDVQRYRNPKMAKLHLAVPFELGTQITFVPAADISLDTLPRLASAGQSHLSTQQSTR